MDSSTRDYRYPDAAEMYARYMARLERGENVDLAELCSQYPHLAEGLRHLQETLVPRGPTSADTAEPLLVNSAEAHTSKVRYGLGERLARGGMGVIFKVWDKVLRRELAMKILREQDPSSGTGFATSPHVLVRFIREAEITAKLDHPGVVPIHDLGVDDHGRLFFTMKLVQGRSLTSVFELARGRREKWTPTRVVAAIHRVCETVAFAHSRGVIHRDLKPDNIMIGAFGETYVMDWGIAKTAVTPDTSEEPVDIRENPAKESRATHDVAPDCTPPSAGSSASETQPGSVLGTAWYMPPEQAAGQIDELDERSDIYSVGAILYELLTGQRPYGSLGRSVTSREVVESVLAGPPAAIASLNPRVPSELAAICAKAMARRKVDRYQNMRDMAEDLQAYLENRVVRAYQTGSWAELKKWVRRNRGFAIGAGLAVAVAIAGLLSVVAVQSAANSSLLDANLTIRAEVEQKKEALHQQTLARQEADEQRRKAEGLYLAGRAADVLQQNPGQSLLLALESHNRRPGIDANSALLAALASHHEARTFIGHRATVNMAAISPDGHRIVTASDDHTAIVWDVESGEPVALLLGHTERIRLARFSPDGRYIATASWDNTAAIWDAQTGQRRRVLAGHQQPVVFLEFSPDSKRLATGSLDKTPRLWEVETGAAISLLPEHTGILWHGSYGPDGRWLLTGADDKTARVWDASTGELQATLTHSRLVKTARLSADGQLLLTIAAADDGGAPTNVCVWNVLSGKSLLRFEHEASVQCAVFSGDGGRVITACDDGLARLWDTSTGKPIWTVDLKGGPAWRAAFSPDQRIVAVVAERGPVRLLEASTGKSIATLAGHGDRVESLIFDTRGRIVTTSKDRTARIWNVRSPGAIEMPSDARTARLSIITPDSSRLAVAWRASPFVTLFAFPDGRQIADLKLDDEVSDVQFSPDGTLLTALSNAGTIQLWSASDGTPHTTPKAEGRVTAVRFRETSEVVAACEAEHLVATWNVETAEPVSRFVLPDRKFLYLSPNGRFAFGLSDGSREAGLWDTITGDRTATWTFSNGSTKSPLSHWVSASGGLIASWCSGGTDVQIWDATTGRFISRVDVALRLTSLAFSPEGRWLVSGCRDSEAKLWNVQTGKAQKEFVGQETSAVAAVVGPDAERIVTRSLDRVTRLWNGRTGKSLQVLASDADYIDLAWFCQDGSSLLTQNTAKTVVALWDARNGQKIWAMASSPERFDISALSPDDKWALTLIGDGTGRIWPVDLAAGAKRHKPRELTPDEVEMLKVGSDTDRSAYSDAWNLRRLHKAIQLAARLIPTDEVHSKVIAGFASQQTRSCLSAVHNPQAKGALEPLLDRLDKAVEHPADTTTTLRSTVLSIESQLKKHDSPGDIH
ncbi:MAG TPA: protein kinase [Pirellulales bacterium]|nr:protein kinase [Pirellulales bacterium]